MPLTEYFNIEIIGILINPILLKSLSILIDKR